MPAFIDLERKVVIIKPPGTTAALGESVIDGETAERCSLTDGQELTTAQIDALLDGAVARYLRLDAIEANRRSAAPQPEAPKPVMADRPRQNVNLAALQSPLRPAAAATPASVGVAIGGLVSVTGWLWAAISTVIQKRRADDLIRDFREQNDFDISAVQIQQLSGEVTAHGVTALVIAMACSMPLAIALALRRN